MCSIPPNCSVSPGASNGNMGCPGLMATGPNWTNSTPCGINLDQEMVKADNLGTTFSQNAWASAQQEGCLGCPNRYPQWPEPAVRPQLEIPIQATVGNDPNFGVNDAPYVFLAFHRCPGRVGNTTAGSATTGPATTGPATTGPATGPAKANASRRGTRAERRRGNARRR